MAPAGRWQKNRGASAPLDTQSDLADVTWYNKDKAGAEDERRKEIKRIKRAEEDALSIALCVLRRHRASLIYAAGLLPRLARSATRTRRRRR